MALVNKLLNEINKLKAKSTSIDLSLIIYGAILAISGVGAICAILAIYRRMDKSRDNFFSNVTNRIKECRKINDPVKIGNLDEEINNLMWKRI